MYKVVSENGKWLIYNPDTHALIGMHFATKGDADRYAAQVNVIEQKNQRITELEAALREVRDALPMPDTFSHGGGSVLLRIHAIVDKAMGGGE